MGRFFQKWHEVAGLIVAMLLWYFSPQLLRSVDQTAAVLDAGVLQLLLFAIIGILVGHFIVRMGMRFGWPTLDDYLKTEFKHDFNQISKWEKLKLSCAVFFCLLFAFVALMHTL